MPSDTFNLQIFDTGISIPALHATTHLTGGADAIPAAVASVAGVGGSAGLMSALQAQQLVTNNGKVTNADHDGDVSGATTLTIGAGKVTTAKILDLNVTTAKIAAAAVTTNKIADGNVTLAKIQDIGGNTIVGRTGSGEGQASDISCSPLAFEILESPLPTDIRTLLELGSLATQASNSVTITGGSISGVTLSGISVNVSNATGTLPASHGGTGIASYTSGDLLYASGLTAISALPKGATNYVLHGSGLGSTPSWGQINLATDVTGILPQVNGGTGGASIDTLTFDTTDVSTDALATGEVRWNATDKTLDLKLAGDVTLQVGQETNLLVHASTAVNNGQVVYIAGLASGLPAVLLADNTTITAGKTLGVATQNIANNSNGYITIIGLVRNLNILTSLGAPITAGDTIWLGTSGNLTKTEPSYPASKVRIGHVISPTDTDGSVYVNINFDPTGTVNGSSKIGYATGAGGVVVQGTSKTTLVTLDKTCGKITMFAATSIAGNSTVSFQLTNNRIEANDVLILNHSSVGSVGTYLLNAQCAAGSATINVRNTSNSALEEGIVISFVVIRGSSS